MSAWCFVRLVVVGIPVLCLGCATASKPAPGPPVPPAQPTLQVGDTTVVALSPAAAPCCKKQTLPEYLGLDQLAAGVCGAIRGLGARLSARLDLAGRFPAIQDPPPPLLSITDPANLGPNAPPAVHAAAEVKAEEDAAAQKVQALKYLATIGCGGCYPSVEDALLAALDDCTEIVRYEAAVALRGSDAACRYCSSDSCCSPAVKKKLQKIAFETDRSGCASEPSERVRREARLALAACGGSIQTTDVPEEGPEGPTLATPAVAERSSLYDTIQLVSFTESVPVDEADDIVLAQVNGQPIFESQVAALVVAEFEGRGMDVESPGGRKQNRAEMRHQLSRMIDAKLLQQAARAELRLNQDPTPSQTVSWLEQELSVNTDVHPAEIAKLYAAEQSRYNIPAKARWERITIPLASYSNREQAHEAISYLRQRAMGGAVRPGPGFDSTTVETQTHAWSSRNQISSRLIADVVFRMPVGQLSPIIEDQQAFHLVRVLERVAARTTSQEEAAAEIREQIIERRRDEAGRRLLANLQRSAEVWTAFQTVPRGEHDRDPLARLESQSSADNGAGKPRIANVAPTSAMLPIKTDSALTGTDPSLLEFSPTSKSSPELRFSRLPSP